MTGDQFHWWGKPLKSRRFHIFEGNGPFAGSLCGNWQMSYDGVDPEVDLEDDTFTEGKDCKECAREAGLIDDD